MSLASFLSTYGYAALVLGTFMEGETILIMGGFVAHQGYLKLPLVILSAFLGSLLGDQLFFFIGRSKGKEFLAKHPSWQRRAEMVHPFLARYQTGIILGFRFLYGFRTVTPLVLGMSKTRTVYFVVLNAISALLWAAAVGTGGYFFGAILEALLGNLKHYEIAALTGIAGIGAIIWLARSFRRRRRDH
jgi:membrane protein DedA with SNARE-associated domain